MSGRFFFCLFILATSTLPVCAELPYQSKGWGKEEAAAHLLSRFTHGPTPGQIEEVVDVGLEDWLNSQLRTVEPGKELESRLLNLPPAYTMDNREITETYPRPGTVKKQMEKAGLLTGDRKKDRELTEAFLRENGWRPYKELGLTLFAQKLLHARHSENQVREVMTAFWFNHFNVALSNNRAQPFMLSYERDAIRPNALGKFRTLLGATAKHPAMLLYLDNANSSASADAQSTMESRMDAVDRNPQRIEEAKKRLRKRKKGLNENYARELMELHTLGVDGGYTQDDVIAVARAFTGWTVVGRKARMMNQQPNARQERLGIRQYGDFRFAAALHDAESKTVLGHNFAAGGGIDEGERVLNILAVHPKTARHLATKLAVRFIADNPAEKDVERIAKAYRDSDGDVAQTLMAVAKCDGFWDKKNRQGKVKSPFELVVSANRALEGELYPSRHLYGWLAKMGQPLYNYQAPTGFPDSAEFWVSSATVLNRVNFALQAATGGVPGFTYTLDDEPTLRAAVESLILYADEADSTTAKVESLMTDSDNIRLTTEQKFQARPNLGGKLESQPLPKLRLTPEQKQTATMIGLILGTPQFQRR